MSDPIKTTEGILKVLAACNQTILGFVAKLIQYNPQHPVREEITGGEQLQWGEVLEHLLNATTRETLWEPLVSLIVIAGVVLGAVRQLAGDPTRYALLIIAAILLIPMVGVTARATTLGPGHKAVIFLIVVCLLAYSVMLGADIHAVANPRPIGKALEYSIPAGITWLIGVLAWVTWRVGTTGHQSRRKGLFGWILIAAGTIATFTRTQAAGLLLMAAIALLLAWSSTAPPRTHQIIENRETTTG